ncbi:MAG: hypothetical protein IJ525_02625 [Alphaproteobacteria bacterium]|nr:hypothetical protein [Alphaproteobacteria bacterium]
MKKYNLKNIKSHHSQSLAKANASRDLQINFNQAKDASTIPAESRHDYKCGSTTQRGRSMIEMLGVLAIIGVLSVGGIAGYSKAMMKYRINKTIEQITLIAGNVRAFWGPQKNYDGAYCLSSCNASGCTGYAGVNAQGNPTTAYNGCPIVKKAKIFPDEMITVTDGKIMSITNPFGGGVWLETHNKAKSGDHQAFDIYYIGLPQEACIELATYDWSNAGASIININGDYVSKTPADLDIATQYCDDNADMWLYFDVDANATYWTEVLGER